MEHKEFIRRGKEKFMYIDKGYCNWCKGENVDTYDVIGLIFCSECIKRITRLSPRTGDIQFRRIPAKPTR